MANEGPRVLVVDDNRDVADSTVWLLRLTGFDARACYGGAAALLEAPDFDPDVCLVDLNMPGMDGDEAAVLLAVALPGVVLVAVTAQGDARSHRRVETAGFHRHLVKPASPEELVAAAGSGRRATSTTAEALKFVGV